MASKKADPITVFGALGQFILGDMLARDLVEGNLFADKVLAPETKAGIAP